MEQNREPRSKPTCYSQLIFDRGSKHTQWDKAVYSISGVGKIGQIHAEK